MAGARFQLRRLQLPVDILFNPGEERALEESIGCLVRWAGRSEGALQALVPVRELLIQAQVLGVSLCHIVVGSPSMQAQNSLLLLLRGSCRGEA